jgi:hypothetical protein
LGGLGPSSEDGTLRGTSALRSSPASIFRISGAASLPLDPGVGGHRVPPPVDAAMTGPSKAARHRRARDRDRAGQDGAGNGRTDDRSPRTTTTAAALATPANRHTWCTAASAGDGPSTSPTCGPGHTRDTRARHTCGPPTNGVPDSRTVAAAAAPLEILPKCIAPILSTATALPPGRQRPRVHETTRPFGTEKRRAARRGDGRLFDPGRLRSIKRISDPKRHRRPPGESRIDRPDSRARHPYRPIPRPRR